jgi:hypothetical protein
MNRFVNHPNHSLPQLKICFLMLLMTVSLLAGCASSPNVNPVAARSGEGYVDFYSTNKVELSWQVQDTNESKAAFSSIDPIQGNILRLAFDPGQHTLQVAFLNRAIMEPATVTVNVQEGMITPVNVTLVDANASVSVKDVTRRTYYGQYMRHAATPTSDTTVYQLETQVLPTTAYVPKEEMPYSIRN